ncbi:hypothetical protein PLESTB_000435900 [Pleodorina starrii]|uniref:Uncharacterized protein n=1 Tax=Pleodorina starrii TaxID=330485 RepID=A0A9W6BES9_9CHLO|nr:hypothetical protein PLESTM_002025900 [Pleodorina starrii]GLC50822.1 hypothetical protein PLESTB_000435900 [Pleodorina starrii]GLC73984.1 hypothetical protein PLESTF_001444600 [Pleodorina starrii]
MATKLHFDSHQNIHIPRCRTGPRLSVHSFTSRRSSVVANANFGEFFSGFFDGSWAPKSTRIWRTQSFEYGKDEETSSSSSGSSSEDTDRALDDLQARLSSVPASARPALGDADTDTGGSGSGAADSTDSSGFDGMSPLSRSFSEVDDGDLAAALNRRIGQIAATTASYDSEVSEEEMRTPLSAEELRRLIYTKYGKTYDVSFVRRDIPGKTFVCLNIMWNHLEQRSFKLTEQQYMEKLDGVAYLVGALGQTDKVRAFLKEPARSQKGLPPRPVVGTAISIRFDLEPGVIEEWFGNGYQ